MFLFNIHNIFCFKIKTDILAVYVAFILHTTAYLIQQINLPFIAKDLHMSDATFGLLQSFFWALKIIGGPSFAILTGRFGLKMSIHICNLMVILLYLIVLVMDVSLFSKTIVYI